MAWGVQTWDAQGNPNNYGFTPVSVVGIVSVAFEQVSGGWSFNVPAGFVLDYMQAPTSFGNTAVRRSINISGGNINLSSAGSSNFGFGSEWAQAAYIIFFIKKAS